MMGLVKLSRRHRVFSSLNSKTALNPDEKKFAAEKDNFGAIVLLPEKTGIFYALPPGFKKAKPRDFN